MTPASCLVLLLCAALPTHSFAHGTTILPAPCLSTGAPASMTRGVGGAARFQASRRTPHRAQVPSFTMPSDEFTVEAWVRREGSKRRRAETWLSFGTAQRARGLQVGFDENDVPRVSFWGDTLETLLSGLSSLISIMFFVFLLLVVIASGRTLKTKRSGP